MMAELYAYMHAFVYRICCCIHFTRLIHAYFFSCLNVIKLAYFLINKLHQPIVPFLSCQRLITHFHGCSSLYAHTGTGTHQHQPFIGTLHIFSLFFHMTSFSWFGWRMPYRPTKHIQRYSIWTISFHFVAVRFILLCFCTFHIWHLVGSTLCFVRFHSVFSIWLIYTRFPLLCWILFCYLLCGGVHFRFVSYIKREWERDWEWMNEWAVWYGIWLRVCAWHVYEMCEWRMVWNGNGDDEWDRDRKLTIFDRVWDGEHQT